MTMLTEILHRDAITAVDKLATPADSVIADVATLGVLAQTTKYYANVAGYNRFGNTVPATADDVTTATDGNNTHGVRMTLTQLTGSDGYDLFCSTDAHPKWVARVTEAQRALGGRIFAVGGLVTGDLAAESAEKIKTALNSDTTVGGFFTATRSGADVILTANTNAADDSTMNVAFEDNTCVGLTADVSSVHTTPGVAPVCQVETATAVGTIATSGNAKVVITSSLIATTTINVAVVATDVAATWAGKARTALSNTGAVTAAYSVGGSGATVVLTALAAAADDASLNIALFNDSCTGITAAPTSADTTPGVAPVCQIETATVGVGTITSDGHIRVTIASGLMTTQVFDVAIVTGDTAATIGPKIKTAINVAPVTTYYTVGGTTNTVTLTALTAAAHDATLNIGMIDDISVGITTADTSTTTIPGDLGTAQVETLTIHTGDAIGDPGYANVTITSNILSGSPKVYHAYVDALDDEDAIALKVKNELLDNADVTTLYTVGGSLHTVSLTTKTNAADDTSLKINIANGTCTGITSTDSADTTPGDAPTQQVETGTVIATVSTAGDADVVVTANGIATQTVRFLVAIGDNATAVATKARTALNLNGVITGFFTVGAVVDADIVLTAKAAAAVDNTMNIAIHNGAGTGAITAATSVSNPVGNAGTLQVETATAVGTITRSGYASVIVTAPGMTNTPKTVQVAVVKDDIAATWAGKVRTALAADTDIGSGAGRFFDVTGAGADIVLTARVKAADSAINIALANGAGLGITEAPTSTTSPSGSLGTAQVETATIAGSITTTGNATITVTAAGMDPTEVVVSVALSASTGPGAGKIDVYCVGTGLADNVAPFTVNNAYTPASVTGINCRDKQNIKVFVKLAVTDLRSLPTLVLNYFFENRLDSGSWHYKSTLTPSILGAVNQPLEQCFDVDVNGTEELVVLVDSISGQGAAVSVWAET